MTTAKDIPVQDSLFLLPPPAPKPERRHWRPWHWAVMIVGVPVIAFLSCLGANDVAHWAIDAPAAHASTTAIHKPKPHKPKPPAYDLAGYQSAVDGSQAQAFKSALGKLRADIAHADYASAVTDAPNLVNASDAWLALLAKTNPPPSYRPAKLAYVLAATVGRRAGNTTLQGVQTVNLALLQRGAVIAAHARYLLTHATGQGPRGS
jgi:hypothetical protein